MNLQLSTFTALEIQNFSGKPLQFDIDQLFLSLIPWYGISFQVQAKNICMVIESGKITIYPSLSLFLSVIKGEIGKSEYVLKKDGKDITLHLYVSAFVPSPMKTIKRIRYHFIIENNAEQVRKHFAKPEVTVTPFVPVGPR